MTNGPFSTINFTASLLLWLLPASKVSLICCAKVSVSAKTVAIPPCANRVLPPNSADLVTIVTGKRLAIINAADKPAIPEPMMIACEFIMI